MKRGDVILCKFPHSNTAPAKVRPALVVQSDYYNDRIVILLVAGITGNLVNRKIGQLSETAMKQIDQCLKVALGIH
jgi:mRNA-degrading endonuclease toxin of MazEF toxin-antitoxin module